MDILAEAIDLARKAPYDWHTKEEWIKKGRAVLRRLVKDIGFEKGTYEIHVNRGGSAVSGEVILHHEHLYVQLSGFGHDAGFARRCKGRKDYVGGVNHTLSSDRYADLLHTCNHLIRLDAVVKAVGA